MIWLITSLLAAILLFTGGVYWAFGSWKAVFFMWVAVAIPIALALLAQHGMEQVNGQ